MACRPSAGLGIFRASACLEGDPRLLLQRPVRALPALAARRRVHDPLQHRLERAQPVDRAAVIGGLHVLGLAILADADAGLRVVDAPAADALPDLDRLDVEVHRHPAAGSRSLPPSSMMRSAVTLRWRVASARSPAATSCASVVRFGSKTTATAAFSPATRVAPRSAPAASSAFT